MKKSALLTFALVAIICLTGCKAKAPQEVKFINDEYGVAQGIDTDEKVIYLVFTSHYSVNDEGYFENFDGLVPVLDILKEKGVKASFFPTGNCFRVEKYKAPIQRIVDEGHYLSHHSNHHLLMCSYENREENLVTADSIRVDFAGVEAELAKYGLQKKDYQYMIPPYEYYNQFSADVLRSLGYKLINRTPGFQMGNDWAQLGEKGYKHATELIKSIWAYEESHEKGLNGVFLHFHAMVYPGRGENDCPFLYLGEIIDRLKAEGYTFKTCKDLPQD